MNKDKLSEKSKHILDCIENIMEDKKKLTKYQIIEKWSFFYKEYPFTSIILEDDDIDIKILIDMLFKIDKINNQEITKEKAELEFGKVLSTNYLSQFPEPSEEAIRESYKIAQQKCEEANKNLNLN